MPRRWQQGSVIAAFCLLTLPLLADNYAQRQHPSPHHRLGVRYKAANRDVAAMIKAGFEPGDAIAHFTHMTFMPMYWYYLPQEQYMAGFGRQDVRNLVNSFPAESLWRLSKSMPERLEDIIRGKQRIWFTVSWWEMGEWPAYARLMLNWLDHHAVRELRVPFDDITLYRYRLLENGDATVPVERLADYGDATLPAYGRVQAADAVDWRDSFEAAARFLEETPPAVVGLSADTDTRPATIAVANETNDFQALTCSAFLSAETFTAAAFRRLLPKEESWRPINTWEMNCGDALDEQAMAVFFEPDDPEQCSVFAESDLPQGQYAVMARMLVGGDTATQASLRFEAASLMHMQVQAGVGAFTPHAGQLTPTLGVGSYWEYDIFRRAIPAARDRRAASPTRLRFGQF